MLLVTAGLQIRQDDVLYQLANLIFAESLYRFPVFFYKKSILQFDSLIAFTFSFFQHPCQLFPLPLSLFLLP